MNLFKFFIGGIVSKLLSAVSYYRSIQNMKSVKQIGKGTIISGDVILSYPNNIQIGSSTYINSGHIIASPNATIKIGDNCLISYNVHIRTDMHQYSNPNAPINTQGVKENSIEIENDVWIGYGAQIMSGVKIASGCVIAAGAIVTKDTEPFCVYAGVPARKIKIR